MTSIDRYAVFGHPIKHSKSPQIHTIFAGQTGQVLEYSAQEVPAGQFSAAVTAFFANGGKGLNCTIPLKELAWAYADVKTERAQLAKAVNTLALQADGSILGDNTDGIGLVTDLMGNHAISLVGSRVLVLGAGGASRGIIAPILEQSVQSIIIANRTVDKAIQLAEAFHHVSIRTRPHPLGDASRRIGGGGLALPMNGEATVKGDDTNVSLSKFKNFPKGGGFIDEGVVEGCGFSDLKNQQFDLIINATASSLSGQLPPLPDGLLAKNGVCYDLAYSNGPTVFVRWGQAQRALKSLDGLGMLVEQAAAAFFIWRGVHPQTQPVIGLLNAERP